MGWMCIQTPYLTAEQPDAIETGEASSVDTEEE